VIGSMAILSEKNWRWIAPMAVIYAISTFYVFATLLNVPLPNGPLTDLFKAIGLSGR
jgi:hypothetical protein